VTVSREDCAEKIFRGLDKSPGRLKGKARIGYHRAGVFLADCVSSEWEKRMNGVAC